MYSGADFIESDLVASILVVFFYTLGHNVSCLERRSFIYLACRGLDEVGARIHRQYRSVAYVLGLRIGASRLANNLLGDILGENVKCF